MPIRSIARRLSLALLILCVLGAPVRAQGATTFTAVMIYASNDPAPLDRRLEGIEYKLRRVFQFEHYKHMGQGSLTLSLPGSGTINLGQGYSLTLQASAPSKGKISTQITWKKGGATLLRTSSRIGGGAAIVVGGSGYKNGKMIVTLDAR